MDVQLTEVQRLLSESARDWLSSRWPEAAARRYFDDEQVPEALWDEVVSLGWLGVGISEVNGGSGGSLADVVALHEQLGAALFPTLAGSTTVVARLLDRASGADPSVAPMLAEIITGRLPAAIAVHEHSSGFLGTPVSTLSFAEGAWKVSGEKWFVRDAARAGLLAVRATIKETGVPAWALVGAGDAGVSLTAQEGASHDGQHQVRFRDVTTKHVLTLDGENALAEAMVIESSRLAGIGARAHAMSVEYAKSRVQFGRPIGSFQAIQHKIADMTTDVESTSLATYLAAFHLENTEEGFLHALVAKHWASEAIQRVLREAHQIHGGIGYITEHSLHLYFRNAMTGALLFGAANELAAAIADRILDPHHHEG
jgi:alkylation response protein AidB-like acyl-CoA dehydrogenase